MCTATWYKTSGRFDLFFNRDEQKTRQPALPPQIFEGKDTHYIAPIDGDSGGTWILVNQHGLALALLNHYTASATYTPKSPVSRGHLLTTLAHSRESSLVDSYLKTNPLSSYRPFLLLALQPDRPAQLWTWNGRHVRRNRSSDVLQPFLTTSSFRSQAVARKRRSLFQSVIETTSISPAALKNFHKTYLPDRTPYGICMQREDAETVSFTHIRVRPGYIELAYTQRLSGTPKFGPTTTIVKHERAAI